MLEECETWEEFLQKNHTSKPWAFGRLSLEGAFANACIGMHDYSITHPKFHLPAMGPEWCLHSGSPKTKLFPRGGRESFVWIILKPILCLVLDFRGICCTPTFVRMLRKPGGWKQWTHRGGALQIFTVSWFTWVVSVVSLFWCVLEMSTLESRGTQKILWTVAIGWCMLMEGLGGFI